MLDTDSLLIRKSKKRRLGMSKKIAATLEDPLLAEMAEVMEREKYFETSEFIKHCIRHYIVEKNAERFKAAGGI